MCAVKLTKCFLNLQVFFCLFAACFFFGWCCEHLQHVRCQIDESVFLIFRCFFLFQIKSNQITFIVTSPQHKCLGE